MNLLALLRSPDPTPGPVALRVDGLLERAVVAGATDLHVEPDAELGGRVRLRVDGFFRDLDPIERSLLPRVVARLKVLGRLAVFRTGAPQEGRIRWYRGNREIDLRLSTIPVAGGEKAVIRIFDPALRARSLEGLGFAGKTRELLGEVPRRSHGAVFVTGPSSSGKTTTLYALAREILAVRGDWTSVVSVEDPIEQRVAGISQTEVAPARGLDFAEALAALLRQDPEVILVGETRDPETARMAIEAAFTGHLVLSTFHVGRGPEVLRRLEMLRVPPYLIQEAVTCVLNQRLLRALCESCGGEGCADCGASGYRGRFAAGEVFTMEAGRLVLETPSLSEQAAELRAVRRTSDEEIRRILGGARS